MAIGSKRLGSGAKFKARALDEQVIVITGASSGIGLATARRAAKAGAKVFLIARNGDALETIVKDIRSSGGAADYAVADVGDHAAVEAAADAAVARFGRIDTWVNNAGVAIYAALVDTPRDEHERLMRTNYWGAVNGAMAAVARMRAGGGTLITVGSLASEMPAPDMGVYVASKHAVKGYIDTLRLELKRDGAPIRVSLVKPSGIATPMDDHVANHGPGAARLPPPLYAPELVAQTILMAARRPMREATVGGAGQLQIMAATHFPSLFSRTGGVATPILYDPDRPNAGRNNLFAPMAGGDMHSRREGHGRRSSVYTSLELHPALRLVPAVIALAGVGWISRAWASSPARPWPWRVGRRVARRCAGDRP